MHATLATCRRPDWDRGTATDFSIGLFFLGSAPVRGARLLLDSFGAVEGWTQVPHTARASIRNVTANAEREDSRSEDTNAVPLGDGSQPVWSGRFGMLCLRPTRIEERRKGR